MSRIYRALLFVIVCVPCFAWGYDFITNGPVPFPVAPSNNVNNDGGWISAVTFPKGADDLAFTDRMALKSKGYEPFKDLKAYRGLVVEGEEHFIERQLALMEIEREDDDSKMSDTEYCEKYPLDEERCPQVSGGIDAVVSIGNEESSVQSGGSASTQRQYSGTTIGGGAVLGGNDKHNGSCYPAAKSNVFKNKIMTTGQYEHVAPAFEKALITIFRKEGKCGTIKNDPCGYTCYGLGSGPKCMNMDVSKLTRADAEDIYYERFWKKYDFARLPDVIAGDLFLASMGSGACTAIQQFRNFLGLSKNCKIDDTVVSAVENYQGDIHNAWLDVRQKFLVEVAERRYQNSVLKGWMNSIKLKRENGCHVIPVEPLYRDN